MDPLHELPPEVDVSFLTIFFPVFLIVFGLCALFEFGHKIRAIRTTAWALSIGPRNRPPHVWTVDPGPAERVATYEVVLGKRSVRLIVMTLTNGEA